MPVHFGRHCVAPVLLQLAEKYPALELSLSFSDALFDLGEAGRDLAVRTGELENGSGLIARRVARQRMVVCASPSYLERQGTPQQLEDLGRHEAIIYRRSGRVRPWLFPRGGEPAAEVHPVGRLRLDDLDAIAGAAAAGFGLAWVPSWLVRERIKAGTLVPVLPDQPGFLYDAWALWLETPHLPLKVRIAVDVLAAALPRLMG